MVEMSKNITEKKIFTSNEMNNFDLKLTLRSFWKTHLQRAFKELKKWIWTAYFASIEVTIRYLSEILSRQGKWKKTLAVKNIFKSSGSDFFFSLF